MSTAIAPTAVRAPSPSRAAAPAAPAARQVPVLWLALLATPAALGTTAPVLILPGTAGAFGVSTATATWLVTAFAWAMSIGTPLLAGMLRRYGLRPVLRLAAALVLAGTALVALAPWLPVALAGRAAQALGGAGLVAVAMNLAGDARRMGVISAGFGILGASGPLLGSTLSDAVSWRLSLSLSALAVLAVPAVLRHATRTPVAPGRFDARGAALVVALATALILLPTAPLAALGTAVVALALLVAHIRRRPEGFVPVQLLRTPVFVTSALLAVVLSSAYFTLLFAVPHLLQERAGWTTGQIGTGQLLTLPIASGLSLLFAAASVRMSRTAVRATLVTVGATAAVASFFATSGLLLLLLVGAAAFTSSSANATLSMQAASGAAGDRRPTAIGLFALSYQLGGAFGPGIATLLVLG